MFSRIVMTLNAAANSMTGLVRWSSALLIVVLIGLSPSVSAQSDSSTDSQSDESDQSGGESADVTSCEDSALISPYVSVISGIVSVEPVNDDPALEDGSLPSDSLNLQCAFDLAKREAISGVRLSRKRDEDGFVLTDEDSNPLPAVFKLDQMVVIDNYTGVIRGAEFTEASADENNFVDYSGRDYATTVQVSGLNCSGVLQEDRYPAAFKVLGGDVQFRGFAIETTMDGSTCDDGSGNFALIHFTGDETAAQCEASGSTSGVAFGLVDRMSFSSMPPFGPNGQIYEGNAILAAPEGRMLINECNDSLLGQLRINRSYFEAFFAATQTRMQGAALVDLVANQFVDNTTALGVFNANQTLNFLDNDITFEDRSVLSYSVWVDRLGEVDGNAVRSASGDVVPPTNSVNISGNTFSIDAGTFSMAVRAASPTPFGTTDLAVNVTDNTFTLGGEGVSGPFAADGEIVGVYLLDLWNANVAQNRFIGFYDEALFDDTDLPVGAGVFVDAAGEAARRSVISYNNFTDYPPERRAIVFTEGDPDAPAGSPIAPIANVAVGNSIGMTDRTAVISDASQSNVVIE